MMEKYAGQMDLDSLPDSDQHYKLELIREMYQRYMQLSAKVRKAA